MYFTICILNMDYMATAWNIFGRTGTICLGHASDAKGCFLLFYANCFTLFIGYELTQNNKSRCGIYSFRHRERKGIHGLFLPETERDILLYLSEMTA